MSLEIIMVSEVRERQISYNVTYMKNLKHDTNEPIYKTEIDTHRLRKQTEGKEGGDKL